MLQNFWNVVSATNMPAQRDFFLGSMLTVTEVLADHPVLDTAQVIAAGSHLIRRLKTHQRLDAFFFRCCESRRVALRGAVFSTVQLRTLQKNVRIHFLMGQKL